MTLENSGPQPDLPLLRWQAAIAAHADARRLDPLTPDADLLDEITESKHALIRWLRAVDADGEAVALGQSR